MPKNIVVCCDGTGNEYGKNITNVVHTYKLVQKDETQVAFYDPGVGTGGWEYVEGTGSFRATADKATGSGLQKNVKDAYRYLMEFYETDDKVFLFGFSRGAFTVRSLAGMLHKCGLLRKGCDNHVEYASKIYNTDEDDGEVARGFKSYFARPCPIHFIGVWDTVESLLMNANRRFHDAELNSEVSYGYHALAIDEKRKDFPPSLWDEARVPQGQTVEQVWFAGVHSDIGGWYDERGLSNITLRWMLEKAKSCGLQIDEAAAKGFEVDPHEHQHDSYGGFWKFLGKYVREIPEDAFIHNSVVKRLEKQGSKYKPKNLPTNYKKVGWSPGDKLDAAP